MARGTAGRSTPATPRTLRFSTDHLDRRADPAEDFYRFATGGWLDANPVPADKTRWSGFDELRERNLQLLRAILERERGRVRAPSKVGTFYAAVLDQRERERRGTGPLADERAAIAGITNAEELVRVVARLHGQGLPVLFAAFTAPDERDSRHYALYLWQDGLALPDRDYYLRPEFAALRTAYRRHIARLFVLAGESAPHARRLARDVLAVETAIARASRRRVDLRDPLANYHKLAVATLRRRHPRLQWEEYLRLRGVRRAKTLVVGQPEFFDALQRLLGRLPLSAWRAYLDWQLLHDSAPHLNARLDRADFEFFHRHLLGQRQPEPPWRRAANLIDGLLGEALGALYVRRHFPPRSRARMMELVRDLEAVFRERLRRLPWMTPATRRRALAKFARFETRIGHPRRFRSYPEVRVERADHFGNVRRARAAEIARRLRRLGRRVDRGEWRMTPPTVNAHFVPTQNQIFFPAGILQPPFFDPTADDAVNYGGIAVVIGHEMTHGYDDQGRKFDAQGNLVDWWTARDAQEFRRRAGRLIAQYDRFEPLPGVRLNGRLTAGENIADLGGVCLAFEALARRLADGRTDVRAIDGFTPAQRFFLSYGQIWRGNARPEELRRRIAVDPHSPGRFRVNGIVANLPEFWEAFRVPSGAPMRQEPSRRAEIW